MGRAMGAATWAEVKFGQQGRADTLPVRPCKLVVVIHDNRWSAPASFRLCVADGFKALKQQSPASRGLLFPLGVN